MYIRQNNMPLTRYGKMLTRHQNLNSSGRRMMWMQKSQEVQKEEYEKRSLLCQRLDEWNRNNK